MSSSVELTAIMFMEVLGVLSFLVAFLFFWQRQRTSEKQRAFVDALNKRLLSERGDGKCFSSAWVLDNIVYRQRKLLNATLFSATMISFLLAILYYVIFPVLLFNIFRLGYTVVVAAFGIAILLWTDAFEAYSYSRALQNVAVERLDREDQTYIDLAREALEMGTIRFFVIGVAFALVGPFIPEIFDGFVYALASYSMIYFKAAEESLQISTFIGGMIILILPGILLIFLPSFLFRLILHKGKSVARKVFKRKDKEH